jgi:hypothetical protein
MKAKSTARMSEKDRRALAVKAMERVSIPHGASYAPRPGGLASAVLVSIAKAKEPMTAVDVERALDALAWCPRRVPRFARRRVATVLGNLREGGLLVNGPLMTLATPPQGGPRRVKTWRMKGGAS